MIFQIKNVLNHNIKLAGVLSGLVAAGIWGLWPVITRYGVTTQFTPDEIVVVRFLFAGIILLPYYLKHQIYKKISIWQSFVISSGAGAAYVFVSALGLVYVPAGHLGVVETGTMLVLSAIGGAILLKERSTKKEIFGYLIVLFGMLIVNWQSLQSANSGTIRGDLLLVLGGVLWAIYTLLTKIWKIEAWHAVSTVTVWSLFVWCPVIIIFGDFSFTLDQAGSWFIQGVGQGLITAVFGLWFFSMAVNLLGAGQGALFGALVPVIAVIGGLLFLGEYPTLYEIIGVILTTTGIYTVIK